MKYWGYCRISTGHQKIDRQIQNIKAKYPYAVIVKEVYTGTKTVGRREWAKLYEMIKKDAANGEEVTLIFDEVSRMSRNAAEGFQLYQELFSLGINLVFLKEPHINSDTYRNAIDQQLQIEPVADGDTNALIQDIAGAINRYMMALAQKQIFLAFEQAESEVTYLHARTAEGIAQAKLAGKRIGTEAGRKLTTKKSVEMKRIILEKSASFNGTINDVDLIKITGLSRNTFYKYKKELWKTITH